jgi:hypothetical protein
MLVNFVSNMAGEISELQKWYEPASRCEVHVAKYIVLLKFVFIVESSELKYKPSNCSALLVSCFHSGSLLGLFFDFEDEDTCSIKMSVHIHWTTWCYIPENRTVHNNHCVNLKSYSYLMIYNLYFRSSWTLYLPMSVTPNSG